MGTRFLASGEMTIPADCKVRLVDAEALDAVKIEHSERFMPPYTRPGPPTQPRALRTSPLDRLHGDPDAIDVDQFRLTFINAVRNGLGYEQLPMAGQSVGLVRDVAPAADIVRRVVAEADAALAAASFAVPNR